MTTDEFRRHAHDAVDWIADYFEHIRDRPVLPAALEPGVFAAQLPAHGPERGEAMEAILADFRDRVVPATTLWNHPGFFAYFAISGSPPGVIAEMLAAALNTNSMVWKSGPAATELEQLTLRWLAEWLGLPNTWFGEILDTASTAGVHVLCCARQFADPESRTRGNRAGIYTVYASEHAHSFIDKAMLTAGLGLDSLRKVPTDSEFRIVPEALERMIAEDRAHGRMPICIVATVGTTSVASIDPVPAIAAIAQRERIWLHVDAAYGGAAAVSKRYRQVLAGCEHADSFVVNPHKWLLTPVDLSAFYTRHPDILRQAFSLVPEYLKTAQDNTAVNLMDYGFPLGRRFRSLKLWFVMRSYGRSGLAAMIDDHCAMAREFAARIERSGRYELGAPVHFSLVTFRLRGASQEENRNLLDRINATGRAFLSHTVVNGNYLLRMAIGNWQTRREDVEVVARHLQI